MRGWTVLVGGVLVLATVPAALADEGGADRPPVVPRPARLTVRDGIFVVPRSPTVYCEPGRADVRAVAEYAAEFLRAEIGGTAEVAVVPEEAGTLPAQHILLTTRGADPTLGDEGYALRVSARTVVCMAPTPHGLFYAVQTLRQLIRAKLPQSRGPDVKVGVFWYVPCVEIQDSPRYRWRGLLLDCGRHFMDKEFIKRYIDLLAYHKLNVLHWHLTEDQGWRIEIKRYPRLTEVGAWRWATRDSEQPRDEQGRYGGYYMQADVREIVAYARSRYVTVVPEIEMPGHSLAALAAYPDLSCTGGLFMVGSRWGVYEDVYCAGNEQTFEFLENVLAEVCALFPSEFIHIGGDECPKARWKACPKCQARIAAEGLKDEHELQSYFIRRIERFLSSKGKRLIGWDEILEGGLAPGATVQSWRGLDGAIAAATAGHDVICSPTSHCYLDYAQDRGPNEPTQMGFIDLQTAYSFEPTPPQLTPAQAEHVLGLEGNMWTEHAPHERVDWQVFPRLCALAEVGWTPPELRNWDDFSPRLQHHYRRLDDLGVAYFIPPPGCATQDRVFADSLTVVLENPLGRGEIRYTLNGGDPTQDSPEYTTPFELRETATVRARLFLDTGRTSRVAEFPFTKEKPH